MHQVIAADDEYYQIIYQCKHFLGIGRYENLWVLTREPFTIGSSAWKREKELIIALIADKFGLKDRGNTDDKDL